MSLFIIVWAPEQLYWSPGLLTVKCEHFAMMTSFALENIDLGSPHLHLKEFLYWPTYPPNLVSSTLTGAEIAGGGAESAPPPPPGRVPNSQTLSRERVNLKYLIYHHLKYIPIKYPINRDQ